MIVHSNSEESCSATQQAPRQVRVEARSLNRVPHVTLLHAPGVPPKMSNAVLEALEDAERDAVHLAEKHQKKATSPYGLEECRLQDCNCLRNHSTFEGLQSG